MIVCSCTGATDRTVDAAVMSGAASVAEVTERCGAGGRCGGCWPELERRIETHVSIRVSARAVGLRSVA